jgi:hypothetical protein
MQRTAMPRHAALFVMGCHETLSIQELKNPAKLRIKGRLSDRTESALLSLQWLNINPSTKFRKKRK